MSGYLPTSPYGPVRRVFWTCDDCFDRSAGSDIIADPDETRAAAVAHLEQTGHRVSFSRGTVELILPLATSVPGVTP